MSSPLHADSREKRIQVETREEANARLRAWRESLNWCRCAKKLVERTLLGYGVCRFCGKLIR